MPHMAVEVAIRAFREAEGPMHVDAEAGIDGGMGLPQARLLEDRAHERDRQARASLAKARARCDNPPSPAAIQSMPCFSSAVISPKVR